MATKKIAELCLVKETYTDKEGKKKNKYVCLAEEFETDDGGTFYLVDATINLAAFPRKEGSCKVMMSKFKADRDGQQGAPASNQQVYSPVTESQSSGDESDIPF